MSYAALLATLAAIHLAGNLSPGPNLVFVSQVSAAQSRAAGLIAGFGLAVGAVVWAAAAAAGLGLLDSLAWLQGVLRFVGGAYLIYLGVRMMFRTKPVEMVIEAQTSWQAFRAGLLLNLVSPYCLIFFGGTFAALLPIDSPVWFRAAAVAVILADAILWYGLVGLVFSVDAVRSAYCRVSKPLNRLMGGLLGYFGLRMMLSSR